MKVIENPQDGNISDLKIKFLPMNCGNHQLSKYTPKNDDPKFIPIFDFFCKTLETYFLVKLFTYLL